MKTNYIMTNTLRMAHCSPADILVLIPSSERMFLLSKVPMLLSCLIFQRQGYISDFFSLFLFYIWKPVLQIVGVQS